MILRRENSKLLLQKEQADKRVKDQNASIALLRAQCEGQAPYIGELIDRNSQLTCQLQDAEQNSLRLESLVQKQNAVVQELTYSIACERAGRETTIAEQEGSSRSVLIRQRTQQNEELGKRDRKIKELKNEVLKLRELVDQHQKLDSVHFSNIQSSPSFMFSPPGSHSQPPHVAMLSTPFGSGKGSHPILESPVPLVEGSGSRKVVEEENKNDQSPTETIGYWRERCRTLEQEQALQRSTAEEALAGVSSQLHELLEQQDSSSRGSGGPLPRSNLPVPSFQEVRECERLQQQLGELQLLNSQLLARVEELSRHTAQPIIGDDDQTLFARLSLAVQALEEANRRTGELDAENQELRAKLQFLFQQCPQLFTLPLGVGESTSPVEGQIGEEEGGQTEGESGRDGQTGLSSEAAMAKKIQQMEEGFVTKYMAAFAIICEKERIIAQLTTRLQEEIAINEDAARRIMDISAELATYSSKNFVV